LARWAGNPFGAAVDVPLRRGNGTEPVISRRRFAFGAVDAGLRAAHTRGPAGPTPRHSIFPLGQERHRTVNIRMIFLLSMFCFFCQMSRAETVPVDMVEKDMDEGSVTGEPITEDGDRYEDLAPMESVAARSIFSGDMRFRLRNVNPRGSSMLDAPAEA